MSADLPLTVLHHAFSLLDDPVSLRSCLRVCKDWEHVARSEPLWLKMLLRMEGTSYVHADALAALPRPTLPTYLAWKNHWRGRHGRSAACLLIESDCGAASQVNTCDMGLGETASGEMQVLQVGSWMSDSGREPLLVGTQRPSWSPTGHMVAATVLVGRRLHLPGTLRCFVAVWDAAGRPLLRVLLDEGFAPFYLSWSRCGNYLAMLSNWFGSRVGLRVLDVASALARPGGAAPRLAFVGAAVPLFLSWAPDAPRMALHGDGRQYATWDARTGAFLPCMRIPSSGSQPHVPTFKVGAAMEINQCQWQPLRGFTTGGCPAVPQWFTDAEGGSRLLLTTLQGTLARMLAARPCAAGAQLAEGAGGEGQAADDATAQAPAAGSHAAPLRSLELLLWDATAPRNARRAVHVGSLACRSLRVAVNQPATMLALLVDGVLWVQPLLRAHPGAALPPRFRLWPVRGAAVEGAAAEAVPLQQQPGTVYGMMWSPDGRRLLFLTIQSAFRWVVWEPPPPAATEAPAAAVAHAGCGADVTLVHSSSEDMMASSDGSASSSDGGGDNGAASVADTCAESAGVAAGRLVVCAPHFPTPSFMHHLGPFFEQYKETMTLWAPGGDAFCFPASRVAEMQQQAPDGNAIYLQRLGPPQGEAVRVPGSMWIEQAEPPQRVATGSYAAWRPARCTAAWFQEAAGSRALG